MEEWEWARPCWSEADAGVLSTIKFIVVCGRTLATLIGRQVVCNRPYSGYTVLHTKFWRIYKPRKVFWVNWCCWYQVPEVFVCLFETRQALMRGKSMRRGWHQANVGIFMFLSKPREVSEAACLQTRYSAISNEEMSLLQLTSGSLLRKPTPLETVL